MIQYFTTLSRLSFLLLLVTPATLADTTIALPTTTKTSSTSTTTARGSRTPSTKSALYPSGISNLNISILPTLLPVSIVPLPSTHPGACYTTSKSRSSSSSSSSSKNCPLPNLQVFTVTYPDCPSSPWTFCRCSTSPLSLTHLVSTFGSLPVGLRQSVRHVMAFPAANGVGSAYSSNRDVVFLGDAGDWTVMTHEAAHALDEGEKSRSLEFEGALERDSCVVDYYAKDTGSVVEEWAQVLVLLRGRSMGARLEEEGVCLKEQLSVVEEQVGSVLRMGVCDDAERKRGKGDLELTRTEEEMNSKEMWKVMEADVEKALKGQTVDFTTNSASPSATSITIDEDFWEWACEENNRPTLFKNGSMSINGSIYPSIDWNEICNSMDKESAGTIVTETLWGVGITIGIVGLVGGFL